MNRTLRPLTAISFAAVALLLAPSLAQAYLPPAFYVYSRIVEQKGRNPVGSVTLSVSRPLTAGTEELLGTHFVQSWEPAQGVWPTLSVLFATDSSALVDAVSAYGLTVAKETDLLRLSREQLNGLKDPPHPFYRIDRTMSLKRARQTYAWVHSSKDGGKSVWVEKDTFLPMKIAGPCPPAAAALPWAKAGEGRCELEFRNLYALRRGNVQNTRMTLWKDGAPLLFFTFERVSSGRSVPPSSDKKLPPEVKDIAETILH